jgi:hypothetical protein
MPSLRERQLNFAGALLAPGGAHDERIGIYRNTVFTNYRNALGATYGVVAQLVGTPFFHAAVDAYVLAHPSVGGDLNVYGDGFGSFLAGYEHAQDLPYLRDVARLEWAVDEASRAADAAGDPASILRELATIPAEAITAQKFSLDPSCRFVASQYPVLRIWQVHAPGFAGDRAVDFGAAPDRVLVRREAGVPVLQRLAVGDFAWLQALAAGDELASALDRAMTADTTFDLGTALRRFVADRTIMQLVTGQCGRGD